MTDPRPRTEEMDAIVKGIHGSPAFTLENAARAVKEAVKRRAMKDPKPFGYVRDAAGGPMVFHHQQFDEAIKIACSTAPVYSYAQLQAAIKHEREAAAKVCEDYGASYDNEWNRKLGVANDLKDACDECAAAIRTRGEA